MRSICWAAVFTAALGLTAAPAEALEVGQPAPGLELSTPSGARVRLDQFRGKVVYLDFWASWCGPCRQSFPWMNELHRRHAEDGLVVLAVGLDAKLADAQEFLRQTPVQFTIALDPKASTPRDFAVKAMPSSLLIGRDGRVLLKHAGFRPSETAALEASIRSALAQRTQP